MFQDKLILIVYLQQHRYVMIIWHERTIW